MPNMYCVKCGNVHWHKDITIDNNLYKEEFSCTWCNNVKVFR